MIAFMMVKREFYLAQLMDFILLVIQEEYKNAPENKPSANFEGFLRKNMGYYLPAEGYLNPSFNQQSLDKDVLFVDNCLYEVGPGSKGDHQANFLHNTFFALFMSSTTYSLSLLSLKLSF